MANGVFGPNSYVRPYMTAAGCPRTLQIQQGSTASTALFGIGDCIKRGATTNAHRAVLQDTGVTANITKCLGFAAEAAEASATIGTKNVAYWPADPQTQFIGVFKGTATSTTIGAIKAVRRDSTLGIAYLDLAIVSTATMAIVDGFAEGSTVGDTNGFCLFRIASTCNEAFPYADGPGF